MLIHSPDLQPPKLNTFLYTTWFVSVCACKLQKHRSFALEVLYNLLRSDQNHDILVFDIVDLPTLSSASDLFNFFLQKLKDKQLDIVYAAFILTRCSTVCDTVYCTVSNKINCHQEERKKATGLYPWMNLIPTSAI